MKGDKWDYPELLVTPVGTLFVNVRSAKLLRSTDLLTGTADPYVPPLTLTFPLRFCNLTQGKWEGCVHFTALLTTLIPPTRGCTLP